MPKITVVTITFNLIKNGRKDWFIQNLESVHNQTYRDFEHIIIDGASTDGTIELLEEYQNKGYIKYYSEPDDGIYDAMNKGMRRATGEYITYLNSDDFYHTPKAFTEIVKFLGKSDLDFVSGNTRLVRENGEICGVQQTKQEEFFINMPFCHQTLFIKRDVMKELGGFDTSYKSAGDYDFVLRLFLNKKNGAEIPFNFVSFRLGGISNTQRDLSQKETIFALEKNFSNIIKSDIDYSEMYLKRLVPNDFFKQLRQRVHPYLLPAMDRFFNTSRKYDKQTRQMKFDLVKSYVSELRLFGLVPLFRLTRHYGNTRAFFLMLPVFRKKQTNFRTIYSFFCIPVVTVKYKYNTATCHILNIPFIKYYKKTQRGGGPDVSCHRTIHGT